MKKKYIIICILVILVFGLSVVVGINLKSKNMLDSKPENVNNPVKDDKTEAEVEEENNEELDAEESKDTNEQETTNDEKTSTNVSKEEENKVTNSNNTNNNTNSNKTNDSSNKNNSSNENIESKKLLKTENITETEESYKYGVKITTYHIYEVKTYSDGSTEKKEVNNYSEMDKSTFNAGTSELKIEAISLVSQNNAVYTELLGYVNKYRNEVEVQNLVLDTNLSIAATIRALEMAYAEKVEHTRPNGSSCFTILSELGIGYLTSGENIAYNYPSASSVANGWYNSPGHYANMVNKNFNKIGLGMVNLGGHKYWVQLFSN